FECNGQTTYSSTAGFKLKVPACALKHGKRAAGRQFNVDEKCKQRWCDQKNAFANMSKTGVRSRGKPCKYPELGNKLFNYVVEVRNNGCALSTDMH
ncbi:hypothetical protein HPB47_016956, partial [Ixodes persulcatus]